MAEMARKMARKEDTSSKQSLIDLKHFIQSIQRVEGNPDCFGTTDGTCERLECAWRGLCLESAERQMKLRGDNGL
jgi:hypothetical protein